MSNTLRVSLFQSDIIWQDKGANLKKIEQAALSLIGESDLLILPEMSTTGFSMSTKELGEQNSGETISKIAEISKRCNIAIMGSFIAQDKDSFFNRAFFITPDSQEFADKRHLFRMGEEPKHFSQGERRVIVNYKGFNILLLVCYDLRFPVWSRNRNNEYDLAIYVANWPKPRREVWNRLLAARAIENMTYVCGVNRVGVDGLGLLYSGDSQLISPKGDVMHLSQESCEVLDTITISKDELEEFRRKFPVWMDGDDFILNGI
ncbi:MAG: amidohydrolase [Bacteroidales bacterium]